MNNGVFSRILDKVITFLFFTIVILTILLVFLRYVLNATIIGGNELMEYLFIYTTALGAALAIGRDEHIKIQYFIEKLPPVLFAGARVLGYLLVVFINAVIVWLSFPWMQKVGMSLSPVLRIPTWTVQVSVPAGCILAILYCFAKSWAVLRRYAEEKGGRS